MPGDLSIAAAFAGGLFPELSKPPPRVSLDGQLRRGSGRDRFLVLSGSGAPRTDPSVRV